MVDSLDCQCSIWNVEVECKKSASVLCVTAKIQGNEICPGRPMHRIKKILALKFLSQLYTGVLFSMPMNRHRVP